MIYYSQPSQTVFLTLIIITYVQEIKFPLLQSFSWEVRVDSHFEWHMNDVIGGSLLPGISRQASIETIKVFRIMFLSFSSSYIFMS